MSGAVAMPRRRQGALFDVLARAIVGQQLSAKVARRLWERLENGAAQADAPLPLYLRGASEETLRGFGLSFGKIGFLYALRDAKSEGYLSARRINGMTHQERIAHLVQIKGIGVWTADMVGIFYCMDPDIWPQGDLAVRRTLSRLSGRAEDSLPSLADRFRPYRSYMALQMWKLKNASLYGTSPYETSAPKRSGASAFKGRPSSS